MTCQLQRIDAGPIKLRAWRTTDVESIVLYANNKRISKNLFDRFPYPYTRADAEAWVALRAEDHELCNFAIELDGQAIGGVGFEAFADVLRIGANIGYWLGEPFWGKGYATAALKAATAYAFASFPLERLQAGVFEWNPASARVLEKAGYILEARRRRAVIKDGRIGDELLYVRLRDGPD
jgi:ribosomal-protein-alanine N-acetyltransferase